METPPPKRLPKAVAWLAAASLLAGLAVAGMAWAALTPAAPYRFHGTSYTDNRPMPDFQLTDQDGRPARLSDYRGKVVLLEFGFTNCPNVCPMSLGNLAILNQALQPGERQKVQVLFVTVDPQRDIPATLKEYMPFFDPSFRGLTGSPDQIAQVAKQYGVYYRRLPIAGKPDGYTMDHSAYLYVIDPGGRLRVTYELDQLKNVAPAVQDIRQLLHSA